MASPLLRQAAPPGLPEPRTDKFKTTVAQLGELIERDGLLPGDKLPTEKVLSERLGVSRSVIRESVRVLSAMGKLRTQQGSGIFVADEPSAVTVDVHLSMHAEPEDVAALYDFRTTLEERASALAAGRISYQELREVQGLHADYLRAVKHLDLAALDTLDRSFHIALAAASGNAFFLAAIRAIHRLQGWVVDRSSFELPAAAQKSCAEHGSILEALEQGQPEAAASAMSAHLKTSLSNYRRKLSRAMLE